MPILSEDDFLARIDRHFPNVHPHLRLGRGDDAAVLACPGELCLTSDLFLQDAHFRLSYFTPEEIGHKALAVNLSDVAAMGARPLGFCLGLMVPPDLPEEFFDRLLAGMAELAGRHGVGLAGGDLSAAASLGLSVTAWGERAAGGRFLTRRAARPGDRLFVVGPVGLARAGLTVLERHGREAAGRWPEATRAHLRPDARVADGPRLAGIGGVRGLMDLSDGLARDLPRFLGELGADLAPEAAAHPEVAAAADLVGETPERFALVGGEDYALLGACAPAAWATVREVAPDAWSLGLVAARPGLRLRGAPLALRGFDHFAT